MIGKKRVKEGLSKQKKSQLHTERGGQGKSSEKQESAERGRERRGRKKLFVLSIGVGGVKRRSNRGEKEKKRYGEKKKEWRRRWRVSGLRVIKPGVSSLQRHVRRLNQVDASQPHFHITPWLPA